VSERARYRKVWTDLWASPSLLHLGPTALWVLVTCIVHASWDRETDEGRLLAGDDKPMPKAVLARLARVSGGALGKALRELADTGTIVVMGPLVVLPKFGRWQETADASRKRKARGHLSGQSDGHSASVSTESPSPSTSPSPSASPSTSTSHEQPPRARAPSSGLFHELDMLRRSLAAELQVDLPAWGGSGGQAVDGIGRALDELGGDLDALRAVIRHTAELVAAGKIEPVLFRRMWVGDGFGARLDAWRVAKPANRPERKATPAELAELEAVRASADEFLASMKVESA
jgi:hypothetical protein